MPGGTTTRPAPQPTTTTTTEPKRTDAGDREFTAPVAENDRDGPRSNLAAIQDYFMNMGLGAIGGMGGGYNPSGGGYSPYMGGGYDPFGYGAYDPYGSTSQTVADPFLNQDEQKWGEVNQTTLETLESSDMVHKYGEDAVLVIANGPEDMKQLNHEDEAAQIANSRGGGQETVVLWNPSPDAMNAMLKEGGFKDVVFSGHGEEGSVYMTGADGEAVMVEGDALAEMFKDTSVQNVFLNVCHGLGGEDSVAESLAEVGVNAMGWAGSVADSTARQGAAAWAGRTGDGSGFEDMLATAADFAGLDTREGARPFADVFANFDFSSLDFSGLDFSGLAGLDFSSILGQTSAAAAPAAPAAPAPAPAMDPALDAGMDLSGLDLDMFNWDMGMMNWF